jgi:calcineurin-like phosphoesterase family protein
MTIWFTSDWHYSHKNIIKYCKRPFQTVEEMNEKLVSNWSNLVRPSDTVYFLGDFIFSVNKETIAQVVSSLRAKEVHFIAGNHDSHLKGATKSLFASYSEYKEITVPDVTAPGGVQHIVLCHYPMLSWNRSFYGSWMLHGHCHGNLGEDKISLRMDVGVDPCGFKPISYEQIRDKMRQKQPKMAEIPNPDL